MKAGHASKVHIFVKFPEGLLREIDALAGPRRRDAFVRSEAEAELKRLKESPASSGGPSNAGSSAPPFALLRMSGLRDWRALKRLLFARLFVQGLKRSEGFVGHIPLAKDFVDDAGGESGGGEPPHHARGLLFVFRLADPLALEVRSREGFLVGAGVAGVDGLLREG